MLRKLWVFFFLLLLQTSYGFAKPPVSVIAYQVGIEELPQSIEVLGELKAIQSVELKANISEVVSKIHFKDGQTVAKDQLLIEFNDKQELAELKEKQISASEAKKQYYRLKNLQGRANVSESQIDEQYRTWQVLEAQINTLKTQLTDRTIRAPFSGQLGLKQFYEGAFIEQGDSLITLNNIEKMQLDLLVSERYLADISVGQKVLVTAEPYPEKEFMAQVMAISPQLDANSRMIKLRAHIDNNQHLLKTNMLVKAMIQLKSKTQLTVPNKAILMLGDHNYVYRLQASTDNRYRVEQVKVEIGEIGERRTEIVKGLRNNDIIISQGVLQVNPRKEVVIKNFENNRSQHELLLKNDNVRKNSQTKQAE